MFAVTATYIVPKRGMLFHAGQKRLKYNHWKSSLTSVQNAGECGSSGFPEMLRLGQQIHDKDGAVAILFLHASFFKRNISCVWFSVCHLHLGSEPDKIFVLQLYLLETLE